MRTCHVFVYNDDFSKLKQHNHGGVCAGFRHALLAAGILALPLVAASQFPPDVWLGDVGKNGFVSGAKIDGAGCYDYSGTSVSGIGDVNGDGVDDFAVGAPESNRCFDPDFSGNAYVVYGVSGGVGPDNGELKLRTFGGDSDGNGRPDAVQIIGVADDSKTGFAVAGAGDVNGDGYADLLVGAPNGLFFTPFNRNRGSSGYVDYTGEVYLVFGSPNGVGRPDGLLHLSDLALDNNGDGMADGVRIIGDSYTRHAGFSVSGAGDVNGDGLDDFIIGAPEITIDSERAYYGIRGRAYVVFGNATGIGTGGQLPLTDLNGYNGFTIASDNNTVAGVTVGGAGDFNGDGFDDIVVGAALSVTGVSSGYMIFGRVPPFDGIAFFQLSSLNGYNGVAFQGGISDQTGISICGAGDVNGDGFDDVLVGSPGTNGFGYGFQPYSGKAHLILGQGYSLGSSGIIDVRYGYSVDAIFHGAAYDQAGGHVSGAGDVNADGFADMLIAAPFHKHQPGGITEDSYTDNYLVYGRPFFGGQGPSQIFLEFMGGYDGLHMDSESPFDKAGRSVAHAGDINGDAIADFAIGAPDQGIFQPDSSFDWYAGRSYVVHGIERVSGGDRGFTSATYFNRTAAGDSPQRGIGMLDNGSHTVPFSQMWVDWDGGDALSNDSVEFLHFAPNVFDVDPALLVPKHWRLDTDRTGWTAAEIVIHYLDSDVAGYVEPELELLYSPDASSLSWVTIPSVIDTEKDTITADTAVLGYFAIKGKIPPINPSINEQTLIPISPGRAFIGFQDANPANVGSYRISVEDVDDALTFYTEIIDVPVRSRGGDRSSNTFKLPLNDAGIPTSWEGNYFFTIEAFTGQGATGTGVVAATGSSSVPSTDMQDFRALFNPDNTVTLQFTDNRPTGSDLDYEYEFFERTFGPTQTVELFSEDNGRVGVVDVRDVGGATQHSFTYTPPANGAIGWFVRSRRLVFTPGGNRVGQFDIGFQTKFISTTILPLTQPPPTGNKDTDVDGFGDPLEQAYETGVDDPASYPPFGDMNNDGHTDKNDARLLELYTSQRQQKPYNPRLDINADHQIDALDAADLMRWVKRDPGYTILPIVKKAAAGDKPKAAGIEYPRRPSVK